MGIPGLEMLRPLWKIMGLLSDIYTAGTEGDLARAEAITSSIHDYLDDYAFRNVLTIAEVAKVLDISEEEVAHRIELGRHKSRTTADGTVLLTL